MGQPDTRETYYAQAQSWAQDRDAARRKSARVAWIVAGVATGVAALEALALIGLMPLKTVVPYTLLVDKNTGFVEVLDGTHPQTIKPDAALVQAMLAQYVIAREGYDVATVGDQYRKVALWSGEGARADYLALMPASNPQSPVALYGRKAQMTAQVASVTPLNASGGQVNPQGGEALVRFTTVKRDMQGGGDVAPSYWVALVKYRFVGNPAKMEDRLINPLGFQVISYRRDQEAPPVADPGQIITQPAPVSSSPAQAAIRPRSAVPIEDNPPAAAIAPAPARQTPLQRLAPWRTPQPRVAQPYAGQPRPQVVQPGGGEP